MNANPLKVAVVGGGFIAQSVHIPCLLKCRNAKLVAVCDKNEELARNVATRFRVNSSYADFAEMLRENKLDAVDICTSINTHASLAIQAMEAGCNVLVEKPMALNTREADEMINTSRKNQAKLGVVHDMLFGLAIMKMKAIVKKGAIGRVVGIEIKQGFPPKDFPPLLDKTHWWHKLPGGVFGDTLPHPIYLAREFLGDIELVSVHTTKIGNLKHMRFDEVRIILEGRSGVGIISSSCNWPSLMMVDIFGTKMNIHGNLYNSVVITYKGKSNMGKGSPPRRAIENLNQIFQILTSTASTSAKVILGKHGGHRIVLTRFIESIRNGTELPTSAEDGRKVVKIWEKITNRM